MSPEQLDAHRNRQREYQRQWYSDNANHVQQNRSVRRIKQDTRAWLANLKRQPCTDCKGSFDPVCMDFDHLPGFEKFQEVSVMACGTYSRKTILAEIAKCELVCSNCHRLRTKSRRTI